MIANPVTYVPSVGGIIPGSTYLENPRRMYDMSNQVVSLMPDISSFTQLVMALTRTPTSDTKMHWLEDRDQTMRRDFTMNAAIASTTLTTALITESTHSDVQITCPYRQVWAPTGTKQVPIFIEKRKILAVQGDYTTDSGTTWNPVIINMIVTDYGTHGTDHGKYDVTIMSIDGKPLNADNFTCKWHYSSISC